MDLHFPLRSAFLALPLTGEAKRRFGSIVESLEPFADSLRFQHLSSPHLTLQFWPEVIEIEYEPILRQAEKIATAIEPFSIEVTGVDTFGARGRDSVLFLTVHFSPELAAVSKRCPWPSDRPFSPHITIARIKHPERFAVQKKEIMKVLQDVRFTIQVDRLRLFAEVDGIKQTALEDFEFGSG